MQTVRGQPAGAAAGDAYALAFAEVGAGTAAIRPTVFVDAGRTWGGSAWGDLRRTIAGTGLGLSLIDGLVRTDLAYGLRPSAGWRFDAYIRAGF
jgi:hemolysin activation/secretion protein